MGERQEGAKTKILNILLEDQVSALRQPSVSSVTAILQTIQKEMTSNTHIVFPIYIHTSSEDIL